MRSNLFQNIAGSSLGVVTDAIIGFFLTRISLHSVGDSSFGLWVLASGLLGYYGLLDLGTRNAVIRFVARHNAQKDYASLSSVVSTALAGYLALGAPWLARRALGIGFVAYWRAGQLPAMLMVLPLVALFTLFAVVLPKPTVGEAAVALVAGACLYAAITFESFVQLRDTFAH